MPLGTRVFELVSSIGPSGCWLEVVSSNGSRSSSSFHFLDHVLWLLILGWFAMVGYVKKWRPFSPTENVVSLDWYVPSDFEIPLLRFCAQFVSCFDNVSLEGGSEAARGEIFRASHFAVAVSLHFLRFDLTSDWPCVRLSIHCTAQSHMERSATPSSRRRILRRELSVI